MGATQAGTDAIVSMTGDFLVMSVIFSQLHLHAASSPSRPAIMLPDRIASFSMLVSGMESVRSMLEGFRLDREKPVGLLIENPVRHIIVGLALIRSGYAIASLRRDLLNPALSNGFSTILTDERLPLVEGMRPILVDDGWFTQSPAKKIPAVEIAPDRVIRIAFTSGSTGRPKAIAHTHQTTIERIHSMIMLGIGRGERLMSGFGLSGPGFIQALTAIVSGRTICFAPAADMLPSMIFCGADSFRGSAGHLRTLLAAQEAMGRPLSLKYVSTGGALMSSEMAEQVRSAFGCEILNSYSSEECGPIGCASGALLASRAVRGNCFAPATRIRICGDDGMELPAGADGVIHVMSPGGSGPFTGALNLGANVASGRWILTGDMGRIEEDGVFILTGRADEVINMGGAKFDPETIEAILLQHPALSGAAVLRMPRADGEHEAWAFAPRAAGLDAAALNDWFARRVSGEMSSMRFARLEQMDAIPKTASGKIDRGALRARFSGR